MSGMALRGRKPRDEIVKPTPETLAKLRPDVVEEWCKAGMREECLVAAREIATIVAAISRGLAIAGREFDAKRLDQAAPSHRAYRDPIDRMTLREARLYSERYVPWVERVRRKRIGRPAMTVHELVRRIAVDNQAPIDAAFMHNVGPVAVRLVVGRALWLYAQMAGYAPEFGDPFQPRPPRAAQGY